MNERGNRDSETVQLFVLSLIYDMMGSVLWLRTGNRRFITRVTRETRPICNFLEIVVLGEKKKLMIYQQHILFRKA